MVLEGLGFVEVVEGSLGVWLHGWTAGLPTSWANLAVLVGELEGLDEAEGLVDRSADGKVVDRDLSKDT